MSIDDLTKGAGEWLSGTGPMCDIVISSRIRLARNVVGYPFLSKTNDVQRRELERSLRGHIQDLDLPDAPFYVDVDGAGDLERRLLVERHLISRQHAEGQGSRGVAIGGRETIALMVNEEDHLRMQVLRSGLQLDELWDEVGRIDDMLGSRVEYAFHKRYGYLTACPTNVGTGIRVSVMLHLPALRMTGEMERVVRAARDMRLAIRGLFGEGTEATGDFYQVSNQTTLGRSEEDIIDDFKHIVIPKIVDYEKQARQVLLREKAVALDDKIWRAYGLLTTARSLSSDETLGLLSHLRMGVNLGRIDLLGIELVNELFVMTQPAHLQKISGSVLNGEERSAVRADYVRQRLGSDN
ncbi:MAG: protein arginine kinase [Phycisphaerae bacterium]|nr:protein arginine kinase [Phycisphaerae bacterium]